MKHIRDDLNEAMIFMKRTPLALPYSSLFSPLVSMAPPSPPQRSEDPPLLRGAPLLPLAGLEKKSSFSHQSLAAVGLE